MSIQSYLDERSNLKIMQTATLDGTICRTQAEAADFNRELK